MTQLADAQMDAIRQEVFRSFGEEGRDLFNSLLRSVIAFEQTGRTTVSVAWNRDNQTLHLSDSTEGLNTAAIPPFVARDSHWRLELRNDGPGQVIATFRNRLDLVSRLAPSIEILVDGSPANERVTVLPSRGYVEVYGYSNGLVQDADSHFENGSRDLLAGDQSAADIYGSCEQFHGGPRIDFKYGGYPDDFLQGAQGADHIRGDGAEQPLQDATVADAASIAFGEIESPENSLDRAQADWDDVLKKWI